MNRINTLYPNRYNIINDEQIPIPTETAFFLEDAIKDPTKVNRYYFKFPADWITSNRGESIIGVRNIFMMPRRRKLEFNIGIRQRLFSLYNCDNSLIFNKSTSQNNPYHFNSGDKVRIVQAKEPLSKNRNRISNNAYEVDSKAGNQFIVKSVDESIDKLPGYRLVVSNKNVPLAKTLKGGKRGIVEKIIDYDSKKNKYHIEYSEGTKDFIPAKNMREGAPTKLSRMELAYWSKKKSIPNDIKKWI